MLPRPTCTAPTVTLMVGVVGVLLMGVVVVVPPARASKSVLLSRPVDDLLLEQHNIFRQEEKAANIFKMHWNNTVAEAAGRWASQCQFKHQFTGAYGENLFYSSDPDFEGFDIREILLGGMEVWHDEKRGWRYSSDACGAACHYTQLVWYSTTSVGCAHQMCHGLKVGSRNVDRALYLVCFYYPRGNWVGEYPFKRGRPCSSCGSGTCQDGLCVEEKASYSSYHKESDNEVQSGSSWNWSYSARGPDSHHQASSSRNVSRVTSRHPQGQHQVRHSQHEVRYTSSSDRHRSHHSSSSSYRVSSHSRSAGGRNTDLLQPAELRQGGLTLSSSSGRDTLQRDLQSYNPSHSRLRALAPVNLRQSPRQALYAQAGLDRVNNIISSRNNGNNNNRYHNNNRNNIVNNNNNDRRLQQDSSRRSIQSPLDVIRANTHWCRDRLPSCRIWTRECLKSKAVYVACPRTCGQCGRNKEEKTTNSLRDRPSPTPHLAQSASSLQRQRTLNRTPQQPSPQPSPLRQKPQQRNSQKQQQQRRRQQNPKQQHKRKRLQQQRQQQRQRPGPRHRKVAEGQKKGRGPNKELRQQKRRQRQRKRQQQQQQQRKNGHRRRRPNGEERRERRRRVHKKFKTVDRRAENLAAELRRNALNGQRCEDDVKYARSCPFWVQRGFCTGNELVSNVYCKLSCGSC